LIAVARPQLLGFVGQPIRLNGSRSWSTHGAGELSYEWTFDDGTTATGPCIQHVFNAAGRFSPMLKVTDSQGNTDYDFAKVTVTTADTAPKQRCSLHASYWPTLGIRTNDEVSFLVRSFRFQPLVGKETWDFGDGSPTVCTQSDGAADPHNKDGYAVVKHRFRESGDYIVSVSRTNSDGQHAVAKLDVHVGRP
jgi:hypothetical protein